MNCHILKDKLFVYPATQKTEMSYLHLHNMNILFFQMWEWSIISTRVYVHTYIYIHIFKYIYIHIYVQIIMLMHHNVTSYVHYISCTHTHTKDSQCTYDVTSWCIHVPILPWKHNKVLRLYCTPTRHCQQYKYRRMLCHENVTMHSL
jgi:hypothetical protein